MSYIPSNYDGGFVIFAGAWIHIFSEHFLQLLKKDEKQRMKFLPVDSTQKIRKQYFELVGPSGPPKVAVAGLDLGGWVCETCGFKRFGPAKQVGIGDFVAGSDLPAPLPEVFPVGTEPNVSLCVTAERWARMAGKAGTRGFTSRLLGVVADREVIRDPELKTRREQMR